MFMEVPTGNDAVLRIDCHGKLTKDDLHTMHQLLHARLAELVKPGLVIGLDAFSGYDNPAAMAEDIRMDLAHRNDFARVAIVGDKTWVEWGAAVANAFTTGELRWFEAGNMNGAVKWAARERS